MRKTCLAVLGSFLLFLQSFGQSPYNSSEYKKTNLTFEEANLVSDYYSQTGNHSAILGGLGTQKLTEVSNAIDLKFIKFDTQNRKQTYNFGFGYDHHTAASAAYVNKNGSSQTWGSRVYPSLNWQIETKPNVPPGVWVPLSRQNILIIRMALMAFIRSFRPTRTVNLPQREFYTSMA